MPADSRPVLHPSIGYVGPDVSVATMAVGREHTASVQPPGYYSSEFGPATMPRDTNAGPWRHTDAGEVSRPNPFTARVAVAPTSGAHDDAPPPYKNIHFRYREPSYCPGTQHLDSYYVASPVAVYPAYNNAALETSAATAGHGFGCAAPGHGNTTAIESKYITFTYDAAQRAPRGAPRAVRPYR